MADSKNLPQEIENIRLSLSDLPLYEIHHTESNPGFLDDQENANSSYLFEFSINPSSSSSADNILFCGKIISCKTTKTPDELRVGSSAGLSNKNKASSNIPSSAGSAKPCLPPPRISKSSVGGGGRNDLSGNSRKRKVLIGLAKVPTKMELSDIRERHSRQRSVSTVFPSVITGETSFAGGGGSRKGHSSLTLSKGKVQLRQLSWLPRAYFGCFQPGRSCID